MPKFTVVESPFAGKTPVRHQRNILYARAAMQDCFKRGETPFASHLIYPGTLDDTIPDQRALGIQAGFDIGYRLASDDSGYNVGTIRAFYIDRGMSRGMIQGLEDAKKNSHWTIDIRTLGTEWSVDNDPVCLPDLHANVIANTDEEGKTSYYCLACDTDVLPLGFTTKEK